MHNFFVKNVSEVNIYGIDLVLFNKHFKAGVEPLVLRTIKINKESAIAENNMLWAEFVLHRGFK